MGLKPLPIHDMMTAGFSTTTNNCTSQNSDAIAHWIATPIFSSNNYFNCIKDHESICVLALLFTVPYFTAVLFLSPRGFLRFKLILSCTSQPPALAAKMSRCFTAPMSPSLPAQALVLGHPSPTIRSTPATSITAWSPSTLHMTLEYFTRPKSQGKKCGHVKLPFGHHPPTQLYTL